ncbi:MAG: 50S ribosomal protein L4 [Gammaproteobacteria bacterium]
MSDKPVKEAQAAEVKVALADFAAEGKSAGDAAFSADLLGRGYNEALVHQVVVGALANARQGTRAQKTRAQVSHSRSKMFRQKGTGRARAGMSSTPVRRGGGRAFPSLPHENFKHRTPRRMFRAAMAMMLSRLLGEGRLRVVKNLSLPVAKTKEAVRRFSAMGLMEARGRILLVDNQPDDNLALAARNLPGVILLRLSSLLPADLANANAVVFSESAMRECEGIWR